MENIKIKSMEQYSPRKKKYRTNNKKQVINNRKFKCFDCGQQFQSYEWLVNHATKYHKDLINDEDIHKYLYERRNPGTHMCTICKTNSCVWNVEKRRYDRFCSNPECRKKARELFRKNMKRVYGKDTLLTDPEHQAKMLANRKITTVYKLKDGTELTCVGKFELDFAKHCDALGLTGLDICNTPPSMYITYYNTFTRKDSYYIPDYFMPQLNLAIEIKDGSKYPIDSKAKVLMKEAAVKKENKFNYIKIVDKDYTDFDSLLKSLGEKQIAIDKNDTDHIFIIPETNEVL